MHDIPYNWEKLSKMARKLQAKLMPADELKRFENERANEIFEAKEATTLKVEKCPFCGAQVSYYGTHGKCQFCGNMVGKNIGK